MNAANPRKIKIVALLRLMETKTDGVQGLTMAQIIEALESEGITSERKSIYRDFQTLRDCGFDVKKLPTRPATYGLDRTDLDFDDVMMLIDVVQSSKFLSENRANKLVNSLKSLVSDRQRKLLRRRVHVENRIANQSESVLHNVDLIHQAIAHHKKIEFLYFSYDVALQRRPRHDGKRYKLTPVKVVFANGAYYLAGHDEGDDRIKTYRIDRMELLQVSPEASSRSAAIANYGLDDFAYRTFGMFHGDAKTVTLKVDVAVMDAIVDTFGPKLELIKSGKNSAEVRVAVEVSPQFFGWVAGLNGLVTIKGPKSVAQEYKAWLNSLAAAQ